jgi:hypothetical protein
MRCPACNAVNARDAVTCAACKEPLKRRAKRRPSQESSETLFGAKPEGSNLAALRAYRLSLFGLIPIVGLVLGPVSIVLVGWAWWKGRKDPAFSALGPLVAALILGCVDALTNWGGVILMALGLSSLHPH